MAYPPAIYKFDGGRGMGGLCQVGSEYTSMGAYAPHQSFLTHMVKNCVGKQHMFLFWGTY